MAPSRSAIVTIGLLALLVAGASPAIADPVKCQKDLVKSLLKLKKTHLKKTAKCLDNQNVGKIAGPCPDAATALKIQTTRDKVVAKIAASCPAPDLTTLGFPADCQLQTPTSAAEALCAALPGSTATEFATCLTCWKEAEFVEYLATLYASHAVEVCGGALGAPSTVCSALDCTTPLPDQRDLGDTGENDCQRAIGKAGVKHLVTIEKVLEKCGLAGGTRAGCLADLKVQAGLDKSAQKLEVGIVNKCGNRDPVPNVPFCCRFGMGNACVAASTREECETLGGDVQDNKVCGPGNNCDPIPGQQQLTWWASCPISDTCPGTPVTTLDGLIDCVGATADEIAAELLCIQFATGWGPCPGSPSGAFLG